jgi:hypothetical protein
MQFLTLAALNELGSAAVRALAVQIDIERTAMGENGGVFGTRRFGPIEPSPTGGRSRFIELAGLQFWREAQRNLEQLNGPERVTALRHGLAEMAKGVSQQRLTESPRAWGHRAGRPSRSAPLLTAKSTEFSQDLFVD